MSMTYDVIIIGGGAIGCAIARELSAYELDICVLEKNPDIGLGTSGRNSGIIHAGFNNKSGTLMAKYCVEGSEVFPGVCEDLGVPYRITGKLVIGFSRSDIEILEKLKDQGDRNGCPDLRIISKKEIREIEPYVDGNAALYSPRSGIFNPFLYTAGLAESAFANGVSFFLNREVTGIVKKEIPNTEGRGREILYDIATTSGESFQGRWVINSAGLGADKVARMAGVNDYTVYPCRGEYYVLDKAAMDYLRIPVYPVPNEKEGGLGIHLTPTTDGNIIIGPSSEYINEPGDNATTRDTMDMLIREGSKLMPYIKKEHFINAFAGVRPKLAGPTQGGYLDFVIEEKEETPRFINLIGIESPGLTSSVPIARDIARSINKRERLKEKKNFIRTLKPKTRFRDLSNQEKAELIRGNPDYGEIICRCNMITKREALEAIHNPLGAHALVSVKNRTGCMMGRCQGGFCQTRIVDMIMSETGKSAGEVLYSREGGNMFFGRVR